MTRSSFLLPALFAAVIANGARAETHGASGPAEVIVENLAAMGCTGIEVANTWLGRILITANCDGETEEIVLTRTGDLLRSTLFGLDTGSPAAKTGPAVSDIAKESKKGLGASVSDSAKGLGASKSNGGQ